MPHLQKLYSKLKDKGFEIIAVNSGDSKETINSYFKKEKFTFLVGMDSEQGGKDYGVASKFGVQAYPTNYLLDESGKIVFRSLGFDEEGLIKALEKLGVK